MELCHSFGMEFATLESLAEQEVLKRFCLQNAGILTDNNHVGALTTIGKSLTEWYWIDTERKLTFSLDWAVDQPNFVDNNQFCLTIRKEASNFGFNDVECSSGTISNFICQTKIIGK